MLSTGTGIIHSARLQQRNLFLMLVICSGLSLRMWTPWVQRMNPSPSWWLHTVCTRTITSTPSSCGSSNTMPDIIENLLCARDCAQHLTRMSSKQLVCSPLLIAEETEAQGS